ncbi:MAG: glycosyltransferase family 4 protein [Syntrophorhabdaceae bacterium]
MNICIVSCVFPPEPVVSSKTSAQLAEELVRLGNEVTVIAPFPSRPAGKLYPDNRRKLVKKTIDSQGVKIFRCFSTLSPNSRMMSRFFENLSFGIVSSLVLLTLKKPDVVYLNTWPIVAMGFITLVCSITGTPVVISIQDVYPESLLSQKRLSPNNPLVHFLQWLDKHIVRSGKSVIVISESFKQIYHHSRNLPLSTLRVIPNWEDAQSIIPDDPKADAFRRKMGIPNDAFLALYAGNVGEAAGVEVIIQSFRAFSRTDNMYLLIAGEGSNLNRCKMMVREIGDGGAERILFYSPWPYEETSMVLGAADLLILPTRGNQSMASIPSKAISYMLAARPMIAMVLKGSETAELMQKATCGWVIDPDNPEQLSDKIREVRMLNSFSRKDTGLRGRTFALNNLSREVCIPKVISLLEQAPGKHK